MIKLIKSKLVLIIFSIISFILVVNISLKLISEPSDIAFYFGLLLLFASFTLIYKLINFLIKSLNKPKL
jgi:hypothetical protein